MTTLKPLGGKMIGSYLMFPEAYWKDVLRVAAKKKGLGVDEYCEWVVKEYHATVTG
jgi:hypothetical protein